MAEITLGDVMSAINIRATETKLADVDTKVQTLLSHTDGLEGLLTDIRDSAGIKRIVDAIDIADRAGRALGQISAADGAITALGVLAAAAVTDPATSASVIALLKGLLKQLQGSGTGATPVTLNGSLPAKVVLNTLVNAQSVAAGGDTGPIDLGITNEHEIWLSVNIDQQPWTLKCSVHYSLMSGAPETVYPMYSNKTTAYPTIPATALYLGIWASNLAGLAAPSTLVDAKRIAVPPQPGAKAWVFNQSANVATVTVKAMRVWR